MDYQEPVSKQLKIAQKAIVIHPIDKNKFLLLKRPNGKFDIPGGNLAPLELHQDSLKREIKEETDLDIVDLVPVLVNSHFLENNTCIFMYIGYAAISTSENIHIADGEDNLSYEWISKDDFLKNNSSHPLVEQVTKSFQALAHMANQNVIQVTI